jgi:hypothetical protein
MPATVFHPAEDLFYPLPPLVVESVPLVSRRAAINRAPPAVRALCDV